MTFRDWIAKMRGERPTPPPEPQKITMPSGIKVSAGTHELDAAKYIRMMNATQQRMDEHARAMQQAAPPSSYGMSAAQIHAMQQMAAVDLAKYIDSSVFAQMYQGAGPGLITAGNQGITLPPRPKIPHPMTANVPPLLIPFTNRVGVALAAGQPRIANINTSLSSLTMDNLLHWPTVTNSAELYGDLIVSPDVKLGDKYPVIVGIDPRTLAYYMRLFYTLVQYVPELPRTFEMLQVAGYETVHEAFAKLPGVNVPSKGVTKHLMYEDQPWCKQFRVVLTAALAGDHATFFQYDCEDKRKVILEEGADIPLVAFLEGTGSGNEFLVTVKRTGTFWQVGHPVAMDWAAVT